MKNKKQQNKNLCHLKITVNKQTKWHLARIAAMMGYGDKDLGRVVDLLTREHQRMEDDLR